MNWAVVIDDRKFDVRGVDLIGRYALVAAGYTGLHVLDISDLSNPVRVGGFKTKRSALAVKTAGSRAYVLDSNRLRVLDISKPIAPFEVREHALPVKASRMQLGGDGVYVAGMEGGLVVIDR